MINIKNSIKSEKEIFELKENKVRIMFEYIKQDPLIDRNETYCISETILVELIKELQHQGNITVDLFNSDTSIKQFIKKTLIENMDTDIDEKETLVKKVTKDGEKQKSCRLKYIYQLTEKGKEIVTDLGYEISSLRYQ
jgi:predicted transcriptional regulator